MNRRLLPLAVIGALAAATLAGCAPADDPQSTGAPVPTQSSTPVPSAETSSAPIPPPADLTCEGLLSDSMLDVFESSGWTVEVDEFRIGSLTLADGLWCKWGDFSANAGAPVQIYGWSPIEAGEAATAQDELVRQGWVRESGPAGVYITENPDTVVSTDEEGYGMTYLFGEGWVTVSDTKEGLLIIEVP